MFKNNSYKAVVIVMLIATFKGSGVLASGYYVGDQGARAAGRAGAFTARSDDFSAVEFNPAGLARQRGTAIYFGNRFSYGLEQYTRRPTLDWSDRSAQGSPRYVEFDTVENKIKWQLLDPMLGVTTDFGLYNWGFALGAYAPPGIAKQKFPADGGQRYQLLKRDVQILYFNASAAWKHKDKFGFGVSIQWVDVPKLKFEMIVDGNEFAGQVNPVRSVLDMRATIEGADHFGMTSIVGAWYKPADCFELALSGRIIPVVIKTDSKLRVQPISSEIEDEVVLKRNAEIANDVSLKLPMPITVRFGVRYIQKKNEKELFDLELDVVYETWSLVNKFVMDGDGLVAEILGQRLELDQLLLQKKWRDTVSVRLGGDINLVPERLILRAGAYYESPAVRRPYLYVDFFSWHQIGGNIGLSLLFYKFEVALAYTYLHQLPVSVSEGDASVYQQTPGSPCKAPYNDPYTCSDHYLGQPSAAANAGTYRANYQFLSAAIIYRF
ncbi:MAG: hypothetical protein GY847_38810 [Proteobacteria bacterium]|nr:hypothetical protein [Pseudomonadota bacterium]